MVRAKNKMMGENNDPPLQSFSEHLNELRRSFFQILLAIIALSSLGYVFYRPIFSLVTRPLGSQLYYTTPAGAFNALFSVAVMFGLITSLPLIVYKIYMFIRPALPVPVSKKTIRFILASAGLAAAGVSFGYFVSLPATLQFLRTVGPSNIHALIGVSEYLKFVFNYFVGLAVIFQLPLILLIINRAKPQSPSNLMRYQRHVILLSFVVAAVVTPTPDPLNQLIMAAPIIALYQLSVIMVIVSNRRLKQPCVGPIDIEEHSTMASRPGRATVPKAQTFMDIIPSVGA